MYPYFYIFLSIYTFSTYIGIISQPLHITNAIAFNIAFIVFIGFWILLYSFIILPLFVIIRLEIFPSITPQKRSSPSDGRAASFQTFMSFT